MKRKKRDRLERAHSHGYKAGINGRSVDDCPFYQLDARAQWLGGWRSGIDDKQSGLYK